MADDPFDSPREVLARARDHINDLDARIKAFFGRKPYARVIDLDPDTGEQVHKIRITAKIGGNAAAVAKDAFSNLRDTLDHAVYASTVAIRPGTKPRQTGFPFAHDAAGVHDKLNRELLDVPPEIRSLLEGFRPHKGGNQTLWGLSAIRNTKTHRILVPLGAVSMNNSVNLLSASITGGSFGYSRWDASKNEVEYMRVGPGSTLNYEVNMSFSVLFGDVEVFGGKEAIGTLNAVASEVESILRAIEAETNRLMR